MGKRRRFSPVRVLVILMCLLMLPPVTWLAYQYVGPYADGPTEDPIITLNRAQASVNPNAAPLYFVAYETFREPHFPDWKDEMGPSDEPLPDELVEWLTEQGETLERLEAALAIDQCAFKLTRDKYGSIDSGTSKLRDLARLVGIRVRLAAEQKDVTTYAASMETLNRLARHAWQRPTVIDFVHGLAMLGPVHELWIRVPYAWSELSAAERESYRRRMSATFAPPPPLLKFVMQDRDEMRWMYLNEIRGNGFAHLICPPRRVFGESDRRCAPYLEFARLPVEAHVSPANPIAAKLRSLERETEAEAVWSFWRSPVRKAARLLDPHLLRVFHIRGRVVALQRGNETIAALFAYADEHGHFPDSLDEIRGPYIVDPYTSAPFCYRVTDRGFTLYCTGVDADDDGGEHDSNFGERSSGPRNPPPPPDGDFVFWPLPE